MIATVFRSELCSSSKRTWAELVVIFIFLLFDIQSHDIVLAKLELFILAGHKMSGSPAPFRSFLTVS